MTEGARQGPSRVEVGRKSDTTVTNYFILEFSVATLQGR